MRNVRDHAGFSLDRRTGCYNGGVRCFSPRAGRDCAPCIIRASVNMSHVFLSVVYRDCRRRALRGNRAHIMLGLPRTLTPIGLTIVPLIGGSNLPRGTRRVVGDLHFRFGYGCSRGSSVNGHCHHRSTINAPCYIAMSCSALGSGAIALHGHSAVRRGHIGVSRLHNVVRSGIDVASLLGGVVWFLPGQRCSVGGNFGFPIVTLLALYAFVSYGRSGRACSTCTG